jgi:MFS family permease
VSWEREKIRTVPRHDRQQGAGWTTRKNNDMTLARTSGKDHTKIFTLLIMILSSFSTPFMAASVTVALPSIGRELRMDPVLLSWVATSFLLGVGVFLVPMGRIADIYGHKKVFSYGISIFTIMCLLCGTARSAYGLIFYRFFQGAGAAMTFGTGIALLTSVFPSSERGRILGINIGTVYMGMSLGPFFGGLLTDHFGWRSIFLIGVPLGSLIIVGVVLKLKEELAESEGESFDHLGCLAYGASLIALIYGFTALPSLKGLLVILFGIAGVVLFLKWEMNVEWPMLNLELFSRNRLFAFSNLAGVINYAATYAVAFLLSLYLQSVRGMSAQSAGILLVSQPLVQGVFTFFSGRLSDRIEPRTVTSAGMGLTTVGLFFFSFLSDHSPLYYIVANLVLMGVGFALFAAPNANAVMASVDRKFFGVASGTMVSTGTLGQILSMGITSLVFAVYIGPGTMQPDQSVPLLQSMRVTFMILTLLSLAGSFVSLSRGKIRHQG